MMPWILPITLAFSAAAPAPEPAPAAAAPTIGHTEGVLALGAGVALGITSVTAFSVGFEVERQLRAQEVSGAAADDALTQRTIAALVAWPAAVLSIVGVAGGVYVLGATEEAAGATSATSTGSGR